MPLRWHLVAANMIFGLFCGVLVWVCLEPAIGGGAQVQATALGLGLSGGAGVMGLLVGWWWQRPLRRLSRQVQRMADGDFAGLVDPPTPGLPAEFQMLFQAMDQLRLQTRGRLEQLSLEKTRLEGIIDSISAGVLVTDETLHVVLANSSLIALFGTKMPEQGRPVAEVTRHKEIEKNITRVLATHRIASIEVTLPGGHTHLDVQMTPVMQDADCIGVVSVFYDVSELRRLEAVRRDFVANVSHELRTPLTAIKGCAETLSDGALDDRETARRFIGVINAHSDRLAHLLDDLLSLARLEADQFDLEPGIYSLHRMVETSGMAVGGLADEKGIVLNLQVDPLLRVSGDRKLLEQALINLLENAIKYTPEGGSVTIVSYVGEDHAGSMAAQRAGPNDCTHVVLPQPAAVAPQVVIEISDTGIGIPAADLPRIFERFYRVDKGRSRAMGGTGLGLSIVRHVFEAHRSCLYVRSQLGHGTTFGFTLSLAETASE